MEGYTPEEPITTEINELVMKFKKSFEKSISRDFEIFIPKTFQKKETEDGKINYIVKLALDDGLTGELMFSQDLNPESAQKFQILKIGIEGDNLQLDLV